MTYSDRLSTLSDLSVDALIEECRKYVPTQYVRFPYAYPELNHGLDLLASDEALDCYMAAYGEMHQAKCLGALQNMPYPQSNADTLSVEIVDWGCGQGIGSIAVIDYLKNRDLTQWLKKITLIEPSQASLSRAIENVKKATNNRVRIVPINEYLPDIGSERGIAGITYDSKHVIHVFSNILDVATIDLGKLAKAVSSSGHIHFVLCMGPLNANSFRIDRFAEIFNPQEFFSDISDKSYGRTSDTNYVFTCKTKCFIHYGTSLNLSKYNPQEKASTPVYGEYDVNLHIANGLFSNGKAWVYYRLQNILNQNDLIYVSPDINGAKPDFVIVRPNVGVVIINVFEQILKDCSVDPVTNLISINDENKDLSASPYVALKNCKDLFIENFQELTESVISNNRNLGLVKTVLICTGGTREEAKELLGEQRYVTTYGREFISDVSCSHGFFSEIHLYYPSVEFDDILLNKIKSELSRGWHSYREGKDITLTKIQDNLSKSSAGSQHKISGMAGSGKTQVLATRAVNAQVRTGGDILLLTFNVTLANYMKLRLSEVRADFSWDKMHLDYYHRFFRKHAHANNLHVNFYSYNEPNFFDSVCDTLPKYDAIFIDEVQDYLQPWLHLIRNNFLKKNGEFVVFGDPKQNIYNREIDKRDGNIKLGIIPGEWNKQLAKSHRFSNPTLAKLAIEFQKAFPSNTPLEVIETPRIGHDASFSFDAIEYHFLNKDNPDIIKQIYDYCIAYITDNDINIQDVAIISPQIEILRKIDSIYKLQQSKDTKIAFISQDGLDKITRHSIQASYEYNRDYNRLDKVMKHKFTMSSHLLKLSSIHSFKGWEAPTVICVIEEDKSHSENFNYDALIYTAITRAKENLLIINVGNTKYHQFFNSKISSL